MILLHTRDGNKVFSREEIIENARHQAREGVKPWRAALVSLSGVHTRTAPESSPWSRTGPGSFGRAGKAIL